MIAKTSIAFNDFSGIAKDLTALVIKLGERQKRYTEKRQKLIKERREAAKKMKKSGDKSGRRLLFYETIVKSLGYNWSSFAREIGVTQQRLSWLMTVADDAKLSFIEDSLEKINVRIVPTMKRNVDSKNTIIMDSKMPFVIKGILPEMVKRESTNYIEKCLAEGGRLKFLAEYIKSTGLPVAEFCIRCDMDPASLRFAFGQDDTKISFLIKIAEHTNAMIEWNVSPINSIGQ